MSLQHAAAQENKGVNIWHVIFASTAGTIIEWYDFYIFGSLSTIIATHFFPKGNPTVAFLNTLAIFATGFLVRPFGALVFGRLGDLVGRKYAFLMTLLIMGASTTAIGLVPSYQTIGILAPLIVLILRLLQGLALGGEYGGAATYVAEHAPDNRRGFYTSFIQTTATLGLFISLGVILVVRLSLSKEAFESWGWRIPFLLSAVLLGLSTWMRVRLQESPLFAKLKKQGKTSQAPIRETLNPGMAEAERMEALLEENRLFPPPAEFASRANVRDRSLHEWAKRDRLGFWAAMAEQYLTWFRKWDTVLEWNPPFAKWFVGGKLNAAYNCVDRHLNSWRRTKAAIIWEGEPGDSRVLTYLDLHREVCKFANVLKSLGLKKGDRVTLYMPMIPELPIAMLACARLGIIHSVVFGGFSAESLRDRINDCQARLVITADGGWRRGNVVPLKKNTDEALQGCPSVEKVIVVKRVGHESLVEHNWNPDRDLWWHTLMRQAPDTCPCEEMDAEDPLFILYTSGSTGKPKGVLHTTGGYLLQTAFTHKLVFDYKDEDVYWCTADIGWVTGHSYIVYGPLANGATTVMYEGAPDYPDRGRFWEIIQKYRVNIFYTAPTAIRSFMKWGDEWPAKYDLSSLRVIGTVGEPINPEAWIWYHKHIGRERCPIVDTWWQTETGAIMISPLPGVTATKPGSATEPLPGIEAAILDGAGNEIEGTGAGFLVIKSPWPSMMRTLWGDSDRYVKTYWSRFGNHIYFTGDGAKRDENGYFIIIGRVDDVINVSGHRIGTWEVESALVDHPAVAEAAVIGRAHDVKGQAISAFVTLKEGYTGSPQLAAELKEHVAKRIGALARPEEIFFTADLPKTRSGKIMRRLLRDIAEGRALGDTTTLADPSVVAQLKQMYEEKEGAD